MLLPFREEQKISHVSEMVLHNVEHRLYLAKQRAAAEKKLGIFSTPRQNTNQSL